jgi:DNA-binding YbaB/EbfC family protein
MQPSMKMINQMQARLAKIQQELAETQVEGTAGGGAVKVIVNGQREFVSIKIDPEFVDPEDVDMLEEAVGAAIGDAMRRAQELSESKMGALTGGLKIPGM